MRTMQLFEEAMHEALGGDPTLQEVDMIWEIISIYAEFLDAICISLPLK